MVLISTCLRLSGTTISTVLKHDVGRMDLLVKRHVHFDTKFLRSRRSTSSNQKPLRATCLLACEAPRWGAASETIRSCFTPRVLPWCGRSMEGNAKKMLQHIFFYVWSHGTPAGEGDRRHSSSGHTAEAQVLLDRIHDGGCQNGSEIEVDSFGGWRPAFEGPCAFRPPRKLV